MSARSFTLLFARLSGAPRRAARRAASTATALVSVKVLPQGDDALRELGDDDQGVAPISRSSSTVEDSGDFQEVNVPVTLTINAGGTPIKKRETIQLIQPAQQQTVTFTNFDLPPSAFGNKAKVKVFVEPVHGEIFTANNTATYTVFFTLSWP